MLFGERRFGRTSSRASGRTGVRVVGLSGFGAVTLTLVVAALWAGPGTGVGHGAAALPAPARSPAAGATRPAAPAATRDSAALARLLQGAVASAGFDRVVDFGPREGHCPGGSGCPQLAPPAVNPPTVDAAVISVDDTGRPGAAAEVLFSPQYPRGVSVPVGADLAATGVRWYRWDEARAAGELPPDLVRGPAQDVIPGREGAPLSFTSPYPGSIFRLLPVVWTLRLVDSGVLDLDDEDSYQPAAGSSCLGVRFRDTRTVRTLLDDVVTRGDTRGTCMLLHRLDELDQLGPMNDWLRRLGLGTLQVAGIDAGGGGSWQPGRITMTALDTARLLAVLDGVTVPGWRDAAGAPVTPDSVLGARSRALLAGLLGDQGYGEALSTANWCGRDHPRPGIPQRVPERWIDPDSGTVTVGDVPYGQDVRPCQRRAEVGFAHLTGLTYNFGGDAGVVHALPGQDGRRYVIVVFTDIGYRYADARLADSTALPCLVDSCYPEAFAALGAAVDNGLRLPRREPVRWPTPLPYPTPPGAR